VVMLNVVNIVISLVALIVSIWALIVTYGHNRLLRRGLRTGIVGQIRKLIDRIEQVKTPLHRNSDVWQALHDLQDDLEVLQCKLCAMFGVKDARAPTP